MLGHRVQFHVVEEQEIEQELALRKTVNLMLMDLHFPTQNNASHRRALVDGRSGINMVTALLRVVLEVGEEHANVLEVLLAKLDAQETVFRKWNVIMESVQY